MKTLLATLLLLTAACAAEAGISDTGAAGSAAPDVGVHTEGLTLKSTFTCINSEGGAEIFKAFTGDEIVRCFVMSQGFCDPNWWRCDYFGGSGPGHVTASCVASGNVSFRTTDCNSTGCKLQKCVGGTTCTDKGIASWTTTGTTLMQGPLDGYALITCTSGGASGGTWGHPVLKRYQQ
jgi:hypothetical protein